MVYAKGSKNAHYIDDCKIIYPWFSGKIRPPYNREGDRNFNITLTKEQADVLSADGYNVKARRPRDGETGEPDMSAPEEYHLQVKLNFKSNKPPRIVLITCIDGVCKRTPLNEDSILLLDTADIEKADVKIAPYDREESATRTAYLQNMYVTVNLDRYDAKYDDVPWSNESAMEIPPGDDANE